MNQSYWQIALLCVLVIADTRSATAFPVNLSTRQASAEDPAAFPDNALNRFETEEGKPRLECGDTLVCPRCTVVSKSAAVLAQTARCTSQPKQAAELLECNGQMLHKTTAEWLQHNQCYDICAVEAAALCSLHTRTLLQQGEALDQLLLYLIRHLRPRTIWYPDNSIAVDGVC